jgi:hypothetical protein
MFRPKKAIIKCLEYGSYKETAVFTIIIGINLLIVQCMFVWVPACSCTTVYVWLFIFSVFAAAMIAIGSSYMNSS